MNGSRSGSHVVLAVLLVLALGAVATAVKQFLGLPDSIASLTAGSGARAEGPSAPSPARLGRTTALILGVDDRKESRGRSDTVLVGAVHPREGVLTLISLPRDMLVYIPGHGYDKLGHAYAYGGVDLALATVERLLDIPIDHYAQLNFKGFEAIVDAVGGIDVHIPKRMYYVDPYDDNGGLVIDFQPGFQHLNGEQALKYARFRHDAEGDWGRMRRQQEIVKAVLEKALSPSVVIRLPGIVRSVYGAVKTDLGLRQMLDFALAGREVAAGARLDTMVARGKDRYLRGVYYLVPDLVQLRTEAYRLLLSSDPPPEFLEKAREDQAELDAVVNRWAGQDRRRQESGRAAGAEEGAAGRTSPGREPGGGKEAAGKAGPDEPPAEAVTGPGRGNGDGGPGKEAGGSGGPPSQLAPNGGGDGSPKGSTRLPEAGSGAGGTDSLNGGGSQDSPQGANGSAGSPSGGETSSPGQPATGSRQLLHSLGDALSAQAPAWVGGGPRSR